MFSVYNQAENKKKKSSEAAVLKNTPALFQPSAQAHVWSPHTGLGLHVIHDVWTRAPDLSLAAWIPSPKNQ